MAKSKKSDKTASVAVQSENKENKMNTASNGRNTIPAITIEVAERTVENTFPFILEFGVNSVLVRVRTDDGKTAPCLIGKKDHPIGKPGAVHGILNATTAIWLNRYPVFEPGYCYLHKSLIEAKRSLRDDNLGYVIGGERLMEDIEAGVYVKPPKGVKAGTIYRVRWDNHTFSLWEVKDTSAVPGEPMWLLHDRRAIALINGLEDVYKAIEIGQSIRLHIYPEVAGLAGEKVNQYNKVVVGDFAALKEMVDGGIRSAESRDGFWHLQANPEKATRAIDLMGKEVRVAGDGMIDGNELIGHKIQYVRGQGTPIRGIYEVTQQNVQLVVALCHQNGYSVIIG